MVPPRDVPPTDDDRRRAACTAMAQAPALIRFAARFAPTLQDAEDAYQRSMEIALTKAPVTEQRAFSAWLHTVVRNEALAISAATRREGPASADDVAQTMAEQLVAPVGVDALAEWRERYRAIQDALATLSEAQRVCLILQSAGASYATIREYTGYSMRKIERAVLEGRAKLRRWEVRLISGDLCEEMEPLIDRTVAGEAGRREQRALSRHVRHCGPCRARLRDRREQRLRLGALVPLPLVGAALTTTPDPAHAMAWWDRLTGSATVHMGSAVQTLAELPGATAARVGAGTVAVAVAGIAGLPLMVDAVDPPAMRSEVAAITPLAVGAVPEPATPAVTTATTPARPVAAERRARAPVRARPRRPPAAPRRVEPPPRIPPAASTPAPAPAPSRATPPSTPPPRSGGSGNTLALEFGP